MPVQNLDFSTLSLETLKLFLVPDPAAPKEKAVEHEEQKGLDEFEIRRKEFFQP